MREIAHLTVVEDELCPRFGGFVEYAYTQGFVGQQLFVGIVFNDGGITNALLPYTAQCHIIGLHAYVGEIESLAEIFVQRAFTKVYLGNVAVGSLV